MTTEELLVEKWRSLPLDKQQEVVDFVEFLKTRPSAVQRSSNMGSTAADQEIQAVSELGKKLRQIREEIVASGAPLLTDEEIEQEVAERRGGYQGD